MSPRTLTTFLVAIAISLTTQTAFAAPNTPPVANNDTATTPVNTAVLIAVLSNDTPASGNPIDPTKVKVERAPSNGAATALQNGQVRYTPAPGFVGTDSFTYTVKGARGTKSNVATVTVTVQPANVPPVANDDSAGTAVNTPVLINVVANDTDANGNLDPATVAIVSNPANGTAVPNGSGSVTYTPNTGFFGTDTFTYNVKDTEGATSNTATVTVGVNAAPTANCRAGCERRDRPARDLGWIGVLRSERRYDYFRLAVLERAARKQLERRFDREPEHARPELYARRGRGL